MYDAKKRRAAFLALLPGLLILIIALIIFGPGRFPDLGSSIGKAIKGFKGAMDEPDKKLEDKAKSEKQS